MVIWMSVVSGFMVFCAAACVVMIVKAKKEHEIGMWTLRATDDLMCHAVDTMQNLDRDLDQLKRDAETTKHEVDNLKRRIDGLDGFLNFTRHCAPRKTVPIDWGDEDE